MNRIDRLQAILTMLQSKRVVRAEDLATRFEVSIRTIYRDIKALEAGGVPIGAEAGIGYFISDGYHIPPVMFTQREARALLIGGKMVESFTDKSVALSFNDALMKVKAVIDLDKRDDLESLEDNIIIHPFKKEIRNEGPQELQLDKIKEALSVSKIVQIDYFSGGKGEHTTREIEPVGLCFYSSCWHVMAYCRLREDYRDFRLDRISKLQLLNKTYPRHKHPSLKEHIKQMVESTELILCEIEVAKDLLKHLDRSKYEMGLLHEVEDGQNIRMQFGAYAIEPFARWLLMMGSQVTIHKPIELKKRMIELVTELKNQYI